MSADGFSNDIVDIIHETQTINDIKVDAIVRCRLGDSDDRFELIDIRAKNSLSPDSTVTK